MSYKSQNVGQDSNGNLLPQLLDSTGKTWVGNDYRGNYPNTWWLDITSVAGTADDDVLYTSTDITSYDRHIIENESGNAVDVYVSVDGTNYSTAAVSAYLIDDVTTGGGIKSITIPDNKVGIIEGKFKKLRILQIGAGTPSAGTVRGGHYVE